MVSMVDQMVDQNATYLTRRRDLLDYYIHKIARNAIRANRAPINRATQKSGISICRMPEKLLVKPRAK